MQCIDRSAALALTPLWRLGFRPFFLAGALYAALAIGLWLLALSGLLGSWQPTGGWLAWHRHEMLFGFGAAIIAGFLLTAVQTWTGRAGLSGKPLAGLAALWLAARLAWLANLPWPIVALLELAFLPCVAAVLGHTLWQVRQRRNYPIVAVLVLLAAVDGLTLLGLANGNEAWQRQGVLAGLWLVAALMGLIGGRVIPFFTQRGLGRSEVVKPWPWLEFSLLGGAMLVAILQAAGFGQQPSLASGGLFLLLAAGHLLRLARWYDRGIWREPLLWSLHLAMAWLTVALLGMALWHFGAVHNASAVLHGLTVGAMGGLILAMLARVTLGHTGRVLKLPGGMAWAFGLLNLGALVRVMLVGVLPLPALWIAATCWTLAFACYLWHYAPMLWRVRSDGLPG